MAPKYHVRKFCHSFNLTEEMKFSNFRFRCMFGSNRYKKPEINYRAEEKKILDSVLGPEVYDKRIRPSGLNSTGKKGITHSR